MDIEEIFRALLAFWLAKKTSSNIKNRIWGKGKSRQDHDVEQYDVQKLGTTDFQVVQQSYTSPMT